jgi:hypothetical protein
MTSKKFIENELVNSLSQWHIDKFKQVLEDLENYDKIVPYLYKWYEQLAINGCNTKQMVRNDIQYLLKVIENKKQ